MRILVDTIRYCHEMNVVHRDIKVTIVVIGPALELTA